MGTCNLTPLPGWHRVLLCKRAGPLQRHRSYLLHGTALQATSLQRRCLQREHPEELKPVFFPCLPPVFQLVCRFWFSKTQLNINPTSLNYFRTGSLVGQLAPMLAQDLAQGGLPWFRTPGLRSKGKAKAMHPLLCLSWAYFSVVARIKWISQYMATPHFKVFMELKCTEL